MATVIMSDFLSNATVEQVIFDTNTYIGVSLYAIARKDGKRSQAILSLTKDGQNPKLNVGGDPEAISGDFGSIPVSFEAYKDGDNIGIRFIGDDTGTPSNVKIKYSIFVDVDA